MASVTELRHLTNLRNQAVAENAKTIAGGVLNAVYRTIDDFVDEKLTFHPEIEEHDLEGVVRIFLKVAVLSRIEVSVNSQLNAARADAQDAWQRRTP